VGMLDWADLVALVNLLSHVYTAKARREEAVLALPLSDGG